MDVDISKMSLQELKALAYDLIAHIEQDQRNLQIVNAEITKRKQPVSKGTLIEAVQNEQ